MSSLIHFISKELRITTVSIWKTWRLLCLSLPFLKKQKVNVYFISLHIINHLDTKFTFHASCKEGDFCWTQGTINSRSIKIRGCWGHTGPIITPSPHPLHMESRCWSACCLTHVYLHILRNLYLMGLHTV